MTLEQVRTAVGLPSELITYCLLAQRRPKIIPCGAWLYSTWQVPLPAGESMSGAGAVRLEEIKAAVGPHAFVTVYRTRSRRTAAQLDDLLPARDTAVHLAGGRRLVALVERIAEAYLSLSAELSAESLEAFRHPTRRTRSAPLAARVWLGRHLSEHADALAQLRVRGARWLDASTHEFLDELARRLAGLDTLTSPEATDPEAS